MPWYDAGNGPEKEGARWCACSPTGRRVTGVVAALARPLPPAAWGTPPVATVAPAAPVLPAPARDSANKDEVSVMGEGGGVGEMPVRAGETRR